MAPEGRQRFYFPPPSRPTDYDSLADKTTAVGEAIATAEETQALRDGLQQVEIKQEDLNGRSDLLSPLLDYGSFYSGSTGGIFSNKGLVPFVNQVGPYQGMHRAGGRIVLDEEGLWDIHARLWWDYISFPLSGMVEWRIYVRRPNGTVFAEQRERFTDLATRSSSCATSVVVPAPGYTVEVWIEDAAPARGTLSGPEMNRLTIQHISRSTSNQI